MALVGDSLPGVPSSGWAARVCVPCIAGCTGARGGPGAVPGTPGVISALVTRRTFSGTHPRLRGRCSAWVEDPWGQDCRPYFIAAAEAQGSRDMTRGQGPGIQPQPLFLSHRCVWWPGPRRDPWHGPRPTRKEAGQAGGQAVSASPPSLGQRCGCQLPGPERREEPGAGTMRAVLRDPL